MPGVLASTQLRGATGDTPSQPHAVCAHTHHNCVTCLALHASGCSELLGPTQASWWIALAKGRAFVCSEIQWRARPYTGKLVSEMQRLVRPYRSTLVDRACQGACLICSEMQ